MTAVGSANIHVAAAKIPVSGNAAGRYRAAILFAYTRFCRIAAKNDRKEYNMRILAASVFALGLGLASMSAQAMPLAPIDQSAASREIIHVAQGCGPGFHRGPAGACRPLYNCPPGWHTGPYGKKCFRN